MILDRLDGLDGEQAPPVTIVGSGPAGLSLAMALSSRGVASRVLESGGERASQKVQALSDARIADTARHDDMSIAVARRLGGTSNLWGARCVPYDPIDFEPRAVNGSTRWPIAYSDIATWYGDAVRDITCGAPVFESPMGGAAAQDPTFDASRLERYANRPAMQVAHLERLKSDPRIDIRLNATLTDIHLADNGRPEVLSLANSLTGEELELPVKTLVLACGGLETTRQLLILQRKHGELFGGADGPLGRYYMGHIIGEVADITLGDAHTDAALDFFVDSHGSYARRRFIASDETMRVHELLNCAFWPVVPPVARAEHRSSVLSMVYMAFAIPPVGRLLVAEAIRKRHTPDDVAMTPHLANILRDLPRAAGYVPGFLYKRYMAQQRLPGFYIRNPGRTYGLSYHQEQSPHASSRVWLTGDVDRLGTPKLGIDLRFAREDADALMRTHRLLDTWLRRTGLGVVRYRQPEEDTPDAILDLAAHGTHQIGTTRMGATRHEGVVDANLRAFDCPGLYALSASVLPTSGQANPTLSVVALAHRLAEHLAAPRRTAGGSA